MDNPTLKPAHNGSTAAKFDPSKPLFVAHYAASIDGRYGAHFALPCIVQENGPTICEFTQSAPTGYVALFAAAPDMLAALIEIKWVVRNDGSQKQRDLVDAAIRKAVGDQS